MAVATNFLPLTNSWTLLGSTTQLMIQPAGGPIQIYISSTGAPAAGSPGILLYPSSHPFLTFQTSAPMSIYAMAANEASGVGAFFANAT